ncbi:NUDIX hydrolase [Aquabacterium sp. A7-Y]|uniref:NUDIX domain-containing protein n=1 Tax=Aquabacterium sp. A7-Y TaxID=1349605 RepID=UPI00223E0EC7|nr:NUDIX hydrolase [Aquabacterium sp. A7-Y]MCW7538137.1 NUDIX hydrolase [Aquabacterium sp. A7-Y]
MTRPSQDPHLSEHCLETTQVYRGHMLDVRRDRIGLPDGGTAHREYIVHPGAVMIVPILDDGRLVLERQFRYPLGRVMIEFPAGKLDAGEPGRRCAERELLEETGYRAREWAYAGVLHNAIAYSTEGIEIWFARGLSAGASQLDEGEFLEVFSASAEELDGWIRDGKVTDAKTMIALLWLQRWRAGDWALEWSNEPAGACAPA